MKAYDYDTFYSGERNQIITHQFKNNVDVVVNLEEGILRLFKENECKNTCNIDDYTVCQYESYLQGVAKNDKNI